MTASTSVLIPVFNQKPAFLRAALASALGQDVPVEVIVVDDGSEPSAFPVVDQEAAGRPYIYLRQSNGGVASALNRGIEAATGDYIQWLSSDDLLLPSRSRIQIGAMEEAGFGVSYCAYEDGIPKPQATYPAAQYPNQESLFAALQKHCFINACTVIWHRSILGAMGGFDPFFTHTQDAEMLLRCAERYGFLAVNVPLVRRRPHPGQMSQTLKIDTERTKKEAEIAVLNERYGASYGVYVPA